MVQTTIPTLKVTNVGRNSRSEALHLEGQSDLRAPALEFRVWSEGGSVLQAETGLAVRVVDGKTYLQKGEDDWQEEMSFTDAIAPGGDFMAYLAAVRDVTAHPPETRVGITFTRYSFKLDGPAFAEFTRREMEAALSARGELPPGVHLDTPRYYREMTGEGELWVREDGLPLRQTLDLRFTEQDDKRVQAQITVDFSQFGQTRFQEGQFVQIDAQPGSASLAGLWGAFSRQAADFDGGPFLALLLALTLLALLVRYHRLRLVQNTLSVAMISSMLVSPLLNVWRIDTFFNVQTARAEEQAAQQQENELLREARRLDTATQFDPNQNLLLKADEETAAPQSAAINTAPEISALTLQATTVLTQDLNEDQDGDGLTDFVEQRLGTSEVLSDTDGDLIFENVEVASFPSNNPIWFTDPLNFDSNDDGLADTEE